MYIYIYIYTYICLYIYLYIYIYIHLNDKHHYPHTHTTHGEHHITGNEHFYRFPPPRLPCPLYKSLFFVFLFSHLDTRWRRLIGCLKLQVIIRQRDTNYKALLRKMTYRNKAPYASTPTSTNHKAGNEHMLRLVFFILSCRNIWRTFFLHFLDKVERGWLSILWVLTVRRDMNLFRLAMCEDKNKTETWLCGSMHIYSYVHTYVYVYVYTYIYMCACIYTHM